MKYLRSWSFVTTANSRDEIGYIEGYPGPARSKKYNIHNGYGPMGNIYIVVPLDEEISGWLDSEGMSHPEPSLQNRYPTPGEILEVLYELPDYDYKVRSNAELGTWYAEVFWKQTPSTGPWTEISVDDYQSDNLPRRFSFCKGWIEIIMLVTERLTVYCGPLVIVDGLSGIPYLVQAGNDLETMIAEYKKRC